ncbi:MAG: hypothetical protein M0Z99_02330 [Betaproteobacteria bacterium]|nr:hypothetical protein [Betaproteobacteria bacterium]
MTICPIAIVAGCKKCPAFKICPLKGAIGDQPSAPEVAAKVPAKAPAKVSAKPRKAATRKKK